jgi:phosphatidylserine/phosphatidylglycerophosphate/cardiolipin synthase-like enzyme
MAVCTGRRRARCIGLGESLEARQLLAAAHPAAEVQRLDRGAPPPRAPSLFIEPTAGHQPILGAIASARKQIRLGICNFDDQTIGAALVAAAGRGVHVEVIVDQSVYQTNPAERTLMKQLSDAGVAVHLSNPIFALSFEKDLVIDRRRGLIMTMCLEPAAFFDTRDYGLILARPDIIREVTRVFDTDWSHSAPPGVVPPPYNPTPPLRVPDLIWAPVDATSALTALIQRARHTIDATTEWLDDPYLESERIAAAQRGARVRLILPQTPRNNSSNDAGIALLASNGVQVHVTIGQSPPPGAMPYMHAKTMIVDGRIAYLGSIDLQTAATSQDRGLEIILRQPRFLARMGRQFRSDWAASASAPG